MLIWEGERRKLATGQLLHPINCTERGRPRIGITPSPHMGNRLCVCVEAHTTCTHASSHHQHSFLTPDSPSQRCSAPAGLGNPLLRICEMVRTVFILSWSPSFFAASSILKREKRKRTKNVHFNCVTVYYFTRRQGFTSVPSQGGSTLGMSTRHNSVRQYTLGEFAMEQERLHREMLREHLREEKLNSLKLKVRTRLANCIASLPCGQEAGNRGIAALTSLARLRLRF